MKKILSLFIVIAGLFYSGNVLAQDLYISNCKAHAFLNPNTNKIDIEFKAQVCSTNGTPWYGQTSTVWFYPHLESSPGYPPTATPLHYSASVDFSNFLGWWYWSSDCVQAKTTVTGTDWAQGVYKLWCVVDPGNALPSGDDPKNNNVYGPQTWRVGPDLWVQTFYAEIKGTELKYKFKVCNSGTHKATNFRVGLYYHRYTPPGRDEYSDTFKSFTELAPPKCYQKWHWGGYEWQCDPVCTEEDMDGDKKPDPIEIIRNPTPNGYFVSWLKADSGEFVEEADDTNNVSWPLYINMANPDLIIDKFTATVSKNSPYSVDYYVKVCNIGAATAKRFWVDLYYHRERDDPPSQGQPGDQHIKREYLKFAPTPGPTNCSSHTFTRFQTPVGEYQSYVQADADDYVIDADRVTNQEGPIIVNVPGGSLPPGCEDHDGDGYGYGSDCGLDPACMLSCNGDVACEAQCPKDTSVVDCDDDDADVHPGAEEICDDDIDQNCNGTANDGCAGVDCNDNDGDGVPSGPDCNPSANDCDDNDPDRAPGFEETCGDNVDNDCDGYADDCCPGVEFCDSDNDGACTGSDCPGPRDPECVAACDGDISCIEACPPAKDPACVAACDGNQACIDACPDFKDPNCVQACAGNQTCIDACPPPQDGDDNDPNCGWLGGAEVCGDHIDNDCDGHVDDGCGTTFCEDADNDGYGVGVGCTGPQDCDDTNPNVSPAAQEVCGDGVDDNCDYVPDGMCDTCVDTDGDGYYVGNGDDPNCQDRPKDCDDQNSYIRPGGIEICGNDIDENCNLSTIDTPCVDPADAEECLALLPDDDAVWACLQDKPTVEPPQCIAYDTNETEPCHDPACIMACVAACGGPVTCPGLDDCINACPLWPECNDADGDGWPSGEGCESTIVDCNESIPGGANVNPASNETCDGLDNDCDGSIDEWNANGEPCKDWECVQNCVGDPICIEGCPNVDCVDHDGDGWGVGSDCQGEQDPDDNNPSIYPGAREICGDNIDQSGDGVADNGCILCVDHDGDGFGVGPGCAILDCDDTNSGVNPGIDERCGEKDTDCDGKVPVATLCQDEISSCNCRAGGKTRSDVFLPVFGLILGIGLFRIRRRK
ncbi:putative metal-binding motif-containing protein [Myxococcota bacterium]|nr:putative metal-binding motif-containing protein [Myxococcota bacterium]MBU1380796.1 putative metal-binding motif-containing protein [Myxococcota bacterium]MBU1498930.1 putative metal-binding motif-containing protein [Myxococcota bacterium]